MTGVITHVQLPMNLQDLATTTSLFTSHGMRADACCSRSGPPIFNERPPSPEPETLNPTIGASLIIRIGFWGPLYSQYNKENPKLYW